jgi:hypothetical protein
VISDGKTELNTQPADEANNKFVVKNLVRGDYIFTVKAVDVNGNESAVATSNSVNINTVGINDFSISTNIYPNPVSNLLSVNSSEIISEISISTISGQVTFTKNINATKTTLNLSALKTGIYFLKIQTAKGIQTKKIIKR